MRICVLTRVVAAHGFGGGMEVHAAQLAASLQRRGHQLCILTTALANGQPALDPGPPPIHYLAAPPARYSSAWWRESATAFQRLHAVEPFDLVWSQSAGGLGYLEHLQPRLRVPCVAIMHGSARGEMARRSLGFPAPRSLARLLVYLPTALQMGWRWRRCGPRLALAIVPSEELARENRRELYLPPNRLRVVPLGVDLERFHPDPTAGAGLRARLALTPETPLLLFVGRLVHQKGAHLALAALAHLAASGSSAHLLIAGDGPEGGRLRALAARLGLAERVHWLGHLPHGEVRSAYAAADVCLLPWLGRESFPLTLLEALACGCPVVASAVGSAPSILNMADVGRLVPPGDAAALACATADVLKDGQSRRQMSAAARQLAEDAFGLETMAGRTEELFLACLEQAEGQPWPQ